MKLTESKDRDFCNVVATVKALLSPRGAYLISDLPEGGLNREGGLLERGAYSQNQVTMIYLVAFQFFYPIVCVIRYNFTAEIRKFDTVFIPKRAKINMEGSVAK